MATESRLRVDYSNMMADRIGPEQGITEEVCKAAMPQLQAVWTEFQRDREKGLLPFMELPYQPTAKIKVLAKEVRERFDNFVLLGIGGSALGPIAIQMGLHSPYYNLLSNKDRKGPRMFFLDNVDPSEIVPLLDLLDPKKTAVNIVTKSGGTFETLAQFALFQKWITQAVGQERAKRHFIATTDPRKGVLRERVGKEGYASLEIPEPVGGRFSVLTPVGLFPAAVSGINIDKMLKGAADLDSEFKGAVSVRSHPAVWGAFLHHQSFVGKKRNILVSMPYAEGLVGMAQWFAQIWAESLGKEKDLAGNVVRVGQTPVVAVGATDQHSQIQLYMEGPYDKTFQFLTVEALGKDLRIPNLAKDGPLGLLAGHTLGELLQIEQRAIEQSMTEAGRPNCRITLDKLTPEAIGALFYFYEVETAFAGRLYQINPFDQPGVEAGKKIIQALLKEKRG